ncbi:MAG: Gfo/Idh/MocA family oxidoreductase [Candidatus Lustribacter sp.]|jgi:predicted dehydrogenase
MTTYRVGIVGSGFGGRVHAPGYTLHPRFEPVAIASPNNAQKIATERKIPHAFASLDAMLDAMGSEIDVVSIASPPFEHHRAVMTAVAAGKHVLCEKPVATRLAEAEEMTAAAERAGVANAITFEYRYGSALQALKELIGNGHLPQLRLIESTRFGTEMRLENARPPSSWWYDKTKGGGLANAFMPHIIDLALWLGGPAQSSCGFLRTANPVRNGPGGSTYPSNVSDGCYALAELGGGVVARMTVDGTLSMDQSTVAVHAEGRTAVATGAALTDLTLFVVDGDDSSEYELKPMKYAKYANIFYSIPHFMALLDDFVERIETGGGNCPTFADGLAAQRILSAIGYET